MPDEFEVFADESKDSRNRRTGEYWHYAGILAVPIEKKDDLIDRLIDARAGCESELKSTDLDYLPKRRAAENWIDLVLSDKGEDSIFISVLGLNATRLNPSAFGGQRFDRFYNRFFRSNLLYACKCFSTGDRTVVRRLWHDRGQMEHHDYFPWHVIHRTEQDPAVEFRERQVRFIASDHRVERGRRESHLLQLADIVLGLTRQLLDDTSQKESICSVARQLEPLVRRMMVDPYNPHSRYGHKDKYILSFFPSRSLAEADLGDRLSRARSRMFKKRRLRQIERESGQGSLFD